MGARPEPDLDPQSIEWDAVVIGTGMGGGTLGYELARRGRRVLYLEKGKSNLFPEDHAVRGGFAEESFDIARLSDRELADRLADAGRMAEFLQDATNPKPKPFRPLLGCGTGGSSALYGMVAERFFPSDFEPRRWFGDVGDSTIPEAWPIAYEDLRPWYGPAERLYRVHGTPDPLRPEEGRETVLPPPPWTASGAELAAFFQSRGLHPYQLHVACEFRDDCKACQSYLCGNDCKNDSGKMCVAPAVREHGATLLCECEVLRIESNQTRATRVLCRRRGAELAVRGKVVVLAAGALMTPAILLASKSSDWPRGLANDHDVVGRNFMRHLVDGYLFGIKSKEPVAGQIKELSFNDFYQVDGVKYGTVQSLGYIPSYDFIMNASRGARRWLGLARWPGRPLWERLRRRIVPIAAILEDLPYADNRVQLVDSPSDEGPRVRLEYRIRDNEKRRLKDFQRRLKEVFKPYRPLHGSASAVNSALGHACGTCRFGTDPKSSVFDSMNRAHGLDNLYCVDTSILPSSSGINPSLTIAANALRIAHHLDDRL